MDVRCFCKINYFVEINQELYRKALTLNRNIDGEVKPLYQLNNPKGYKTLQ